LVVEDEKPLAHALEMKLKHEGYNVKVVMNGEEAIAELKNPGYGMMLLDLIMPRVDGFTVLNEMKSNNISMPVIVLSNLGQEEDRKKAKELGAADYFVKSNTPIADIVTRVKALLPPA
jgi:DNA-binding response OmpR family regulator